MMKNVNTYYSNKTELQSFIGKNQIKDSPSLLIQIFSSIIDEKIIAKIINEIVEFLPQAVLIGATTDGEIMNGKISSDTTVLSFTQFNNTTVKATAIGHIDDGFHSGYTLAKDIIEKDTKLLIAFVDGLNTNGDEFLKGICSVDGKVPVIGGHAGDNFQFKKTFVFTKEMILQKGAVGVSLNSQKLKVNTDFSFNWSPIGNELTVTKAEGNRIYTIDNQKAVDVYAYYLGEDIAKGLPAIGIEFPLIVQRNGLNIARSVKAKYDDGSIGLVGSIYEGEKVRIGFGNMVDMVNSSYDMVKKIAQKPSEVIFIYSCTARKYFMGDNIESEILPFQDIAPVSGFFTYGEFFTSTKRELLNQTMVLVSLSEKDEIYSNLEYSNHKKTDVSGASITALTHLINVTSDELEKRTEKLETSFIINKKLKDRMELALKGSKTSVLDWDFTNGSFYISSSWKEMLGYEDDELPNTSESWSKMVHPDDKDEVLRQLKRYKDKHIEYYENTHRLKHKDGHWVWVLGRAQILYDDKGHAVRMIGTHTDITEEKELQLKYSHQAQMIQQTHESMSTTNMDGYITSWNQGSETLFGYTDKEVIGKHISLLYAKGEYEKVSQKIPLLIDKGELKFSVVLVKKSKEVLYTNLSMSILKDAKNEPIGIVCYLQDITERKKSEEQLYYQAHHDALTGLANRVLFRKNLQEGIKNAQNSGKYLALFFIDLDKFKDINDSLGHAVGDEVLKLIAERIQSSIRKNDFLARLSGDEFTVLMEDLKDVKHASIIADKILRILSEPIIIDEHTIYVSGSIGISIYPTDAHNAEHLLKYADTAMYKAKEEGRNNYQFYSSKMTDLAFEKMTMKTNLKQAIQKNEFLIYYQPQIDATKDKLVGIEALIRWNHPTKGLLYPESFLHLAEETGLIVEIDRWVMKTAMKEIAKWYNDGLIPGILALNLPIQKLEESNFINELKYCIEEYKFDPKWLELEITEGQMIKKPKETIAKLLEINTLGIGISVDDFGTGYSSLSLLKKLPINRLKIDKSFIADIPHDADSIAIVEAIIALAHSLKLDIIAEGVETKEQIDFLLNHGCGNVQGFYYSKALPPEELKKKCLSKL